MTPFVIGFGDELVKLSGHENPRDVVLAESLGPIPSAVRGFQKGGPLGAARNFAAFAGPAALGGTAGLLAAKGLHHLTGRDIGVGPVTANVVLPAIGAIIAGLKGEHLLGAK